MKGDGRMVDLPSLTIWEEREAQKVPIMQSKHEIKIET